MKGIQAWRSLGPAGQAQAIGAFQSDMQEQEDEQAGIEWMKEKNKESMEDLQETSKGMQDAVAAAAPGFQALKDLKSMTEGFPKVAGRKTRRNKSSGGDIVSHLLTIRNQVKLYHWQTGSFARHTATDNLTATLDTNIDAFVESYMGRYGRPKVSGSIKLHNFSESAARAFVAKETKYLQSELPRKIKKTDSDLLNMRDTILGDLTKVLYLFTLQ